MRIWLHKHFFDAANREIVTNGSIFARIHRSDRGVEILTIVTDQVELAVLPFQGQQIWNAKIAGRDVTMKSEVVEPVDTSDYLRNYGAFLVHCGATAMGGPSPQDTHPLHGELPNAKYDQAWLEYGTDELGLNYLEIHGIYRYQVAMTVSYEAHPVIRVVQGDPKVQVTMRIQNCSRASMDLMYLAHINFAPVLGSTIEGTHKWDPNSVRVRASFPSHITVDDRAKQALKELAEHPERSTLIEKNPAYDPEAVMIIEYVADSNGYAHTLQVHPDGTSDYVAHQPKTAPYAIRCIQLTDHHECVGMVLPATAGVEGYIAEKANGRVISLLSGESYEVSYIFGSLDIQSTKEIQAHIHAVMDSI